MRNSLRLISLATAMIALASAAWAAPTKNVIVFVADGGGFNAFRAASYYQYGRLGAQPYDGPEWVKYASRTAPLSAFSSTSYGSTAYTGSSSATSTPSSTSAYDPASVWDPRLDTAYASALATGPSFKGYSELKRGYTDSAASGTAMATGAKTYNGKINIVDSSSYSYSSTPVQSISELAKSLGRSTGVVTSVQWSDATPATFGGAHNTTRASRRDIANEMLNSGTLDLIMGAGHPEYDRNGAPHEPTKESDYEPIGGSLTWELIRSGRHAAGWKLIEDKAQFEALTIGPAPSRIIGIPHVPGTLQQERQTQDWNADGTVNDDDKKFAPPYGDPPVATVPTLVTMTRGALNVLGRNRRGFFLMVEGGAVDRAEHNNQPGRLIEEQIDFNNSIQAAVDWVERNSSWNDTLIIITADHETGMLFGANSDTRAFQWLVNRGVKLTPGMWFNSKGHTNSLVPLVARGAAAKLFAARVIGFDPVYGQFVDNTSVFDVSKAALTGAKLEPPRTTGERRRDTSTDYNQPPPTNGYDMPGEMNSTESPAGPATRPSDGSMDPFDPYGNSMNSELGTSSQQPAKTTRPSRSRNRRARSTGAGSTASDAKED